LFALPSDQLTTKDTNNDTNGTCELRYNNILLAEKCDVQAEGQYDVWLTPGFDDISWKTAVGYYSTPTFTSMPTQTPTQTPQAATGTTYSGTAGSNAAPNPGKMAYIDGSTSTVVINAAEGDWMEGVSPTLYNNVLLAEKCDVQAEGQYDVWLTPEFDDISWKAATVEYHSPPTPTSMSTQTPTQAGTGPTFCGTAGSNAAPNPGKMAYVKPYSNQISTESAND
jgi:hypothetical protein